MVAIENSENFDSRVLVSFLEVCTKYAAELNIVFIIGVLASLETLSSQIPRHLLASLGRQTFKLSSAEEGYNRAIDELVVRGKLDYQLGPQLFRYLDNFFRFHSFSIQQFEQRLKFISLEYFSTRPLSWVAFEASRRPCAESIARVFAQLCSESWLCEDILKTMWAEVNQDSEAAAAYGLTEELLTNFLTEPDEFATWITEMGSLACSTRANFHLGMQLLRVCVAAEA